MALPVSFYSQTRNDFSDEKSSWGFSVVTLTAANVAAQQTLLDALTAATDDIVLTGATKEETVYKRTIHSGVQPTNPLAQRENKWLVRYLGDATFKKFSLEIPGADLSKLTTSPQTDFADLTDPDIAAWVTAFEAVAKSPDDPTETVTVSSIQFVGRRL